MTGTLYIVATPIGNLGDLSARAREVLGDVDLVAAEDTRRTGRLLAELGLRRPMIAIHEHSEAQRASGLVDRLLGGESVALVSDAGTPLISDPGYVLVRDARARGVPVVPVPGPSALTAALSVAGLPTDRVLFLGFLPPRAGARRSALAELEDRAETLVFYESTHRIADCLADLADRLGDDRPAFVGREMTKIHEEYRQGTLADLRDALADGTIDRRGEFVLVVGGAPGSTEGDEAAARVLLQALEGELPASRAARVAARITGLPRKRCFALTGELWRRSDDDGD